MRCALPSQGVLSACQHQQITQNLQVDEYYTGLSEHLPSRSAHHRLATPLRTPHAAAAANDALLGQTQLFGNKNTSDSLWNDQLKFFRSYGPISRVTVYKAWDYDGMYHDPGELKGLQFWCGPD